MSSLSFLLFHETLQPKTIYSTTLEIVNTRGRNRNPKDMDRKPSFGKKTTATPTTTSTQPATPGKSSPMPRRPSPMPRRPSPKPRMTSRFSAWLHILSFILRLIFVYIFVAN